MKNITYSNFSLIIKQIFISSSQPSTHKKLNANVCTVNVKQTSYQYNSLIDIQIQRGN
jgi:hypothetical protein